MQGVVKLAPMQEPILITGANGFVGSHVAAQGRERGFSIVASAGDLREPQAAHDTISTHRPAAIVHLASTRQHRSASPWRVLEDELAMLGNLLSAVADTVPSSPVLVAGSASQYGLAGPDPLPESAPTIPINDYGAVKCVLERAALLGPLTRDVRVIWARSFNMIGPGQGLDAPVPSWARQIAEAERQGAGCLRTGNLDVVRDFLDVRDVSRAYLDLLDSDARGPVNVGSGKGVRLREVVDALVESADVEMTIEEDRSLHRAKDPACVVADTTRLGELTAWQPSVSLRQSLTDVLAEWRKRTSHDEAVQCAQ